jgi:hypothetical protein
MTDRLRDFAGAIGIAILLVLLMAMIGSFTD